MKIILINPSNSTQKLNIAYRKLYPGFVPLGLLYLASYLKAADFDVYIHDMIIPEMSEEKLFAKLDSEDIGIVGFSVLTASSAYSHEMSFKIKQRYPKIKIIWGNTHASYFATSILAQENSPVDFVVTGEGELVFANLARAISCSHGISEVQGIAYVDGDGKVINNFPGPVVQNLDDLLYPAYDLVNSDFYADFPLFYIQNERYAMIHASRGCPYRCYFCAQDVIVDRVRYRSPKSIVDEIEYMITKYDTKFFAFADAYFPHSVESGIEFCDEVIARGLEDTIKWITETRVDKVNQELLLKMKRIGCKSIMYGIETSAEGNMERINKKTTNLQAQKAVAMTKKAGITVGGLFVLGMPHEKEEDCINTIRFAKKLKLDLAKFHVLIPYPGTKYYLEYYKNRSIENPSMFDAWYASMASNDSEHDEKELHPDILPAKKLASMQRKAMLSFYLRPSVICKLVFTGYFSLRQLFWISWMVLFMIYCEIVIVVNKLRNK